MRLIKDAQFKICPDSDIVAGSLGTWVFTYTVDKEDLSTGDCVFLKIPPTWSKPQFDRSEDLGYTIIECSRSNSTLEAILNRSTWVVHEVLIKNTGRPLLEGDKVIVTYGYRDLGSPGSIVQKVPQKHYGRHESSFRINVIGGEPSLLKVNLSPCTSDKFRVTVNVFDKFGNLPAKPYRGTVDLSFHPTIHGLPKKYGFGGTDGCTHTFENAQCKEEGTFFVEAKDGEGISQCRSNPSSVGFSPDGYNLFWGDLHIHTNMSDGTDSIEFAYEYARDVARLDFAAVADHEGGRSQRNWDIAREKAAQYNDPPDFATFSGFEWTSGMQIPEPHNYGHRNIYYLEDDQPGLNVYDERRDTATGQLAKG